FGGIETRLPKPGDPTAGGQIYARDEKEFPDYFVGGPRFSSGRQLATAGRPQPGASPQPVSFCVEPLSYVGKKDLQTDIDNFQAALQGKQYTEAYLPAITPGTVEHWLRNTHYKT